MTRDASILSRRSPRVTPALEHTVVGILAALLTVLQLSLRLRPIETVTHILGTAFLVVLFIVWEYTPRFRAYCFIKRRLLLTVLPLIAFAIPTASILLTYPATAFILKPSTQLAILGGAFILGLVVRGTVAHMFYDRMQGGAALRHKVFLLFLWSSCLFLLFERLPPLNHLALFAGMFIGVAVHDGERGWRARKAERARSLPSLRDLPGPTDVERKALERYSKGGFVALFQLIAAQEHPTPYLRLLQAAAHRRRGEHVEAEHWAGVGLSEIERNHPAVRQQIPALPPLSMRDATPVERDARIYLYLLLARALAQGELGNVEAMWQTLGDLLGLRECVAATATCALREYETELPDSPRFQPRRGALTYALRALAADRAIVAYLDEHPSEVDLSLVKLLKDCGPMSQTLLTDALGCSLLAAGYWHPAVVLFGTCIKDDPEYSAAHLHLGDYCFAWALRCRPAIREDVLRDAEMCYRIANALENPQAGRDTWIRREVRRRLDALAQRRNWVSPASKASNASMDAEQRRKIEKILEAEDALSKKKEAVRAFAQAEYDRLIADGSSPGDAEAYRQKMLGYAGYRDENREV